MKIVWNSKLWLLLIIVSGLIVPGPQPAQAIVTSPLWQVHAPYFPNGVRYSETAIFWFGRITPTENYADVRIGYSTTGLYINLAVIDRRLWYDTNPSPANLTAWDAVSLYLYLGGPQGATPTTQAYRFDAQLNYWEPRANYQASYRGDGGGWTLTPFTFTATSGWRGNQPNNNTDDRGWTMTYNIPFSSLGLSGPPHGATWGLALAVHDRDDAAGTPLSTQTWPATLQPAQPQSWGALTFGLPAPYTPPPALTESRTLIRQGLNGATVPDAPVGGFATCGRPGDWSTFWSTWGERNYRYYGQLNRFNIQNQSDISDWPCFSKYYVRFPLDQIPPHRVILGATVTLHQFGGAGAGWPPPAQRSLIQAYTVAGDWNEASLTWNNAPPAGRFAGATWVDPTTVYLGQPGKPWTWDVSAAAAEAYATGQPLDLVFYESDAAYHSGKYFWSSHEEEFNRQARPTLEVRWGDPYAAVDKTVQPSLAAFGDVVMYTLQVQGNGAPLTLVDMLPEGLSAPFALSAGLDFIPPQRLTWSGQPGLGEVVTLRYAVTVTQETPAILHNEVRILRQLAATTHTLIVDARALYLPLVLRGGGAQPSGAVMVSKQAAPLAPQPGDVVTYTLRVTGNGQPVAVLDTLPLSVTLKALLSPALVFVAPNLITWQGTPAAGEPVLLRYAVTVTAASGSLLTSAAALFQVDDTAGAVLLVNPRQIYLPLVLR